MISWHYPLPQLHKCTTDLCAGVTLVGFTQILFSGFFSLWKLEDFLYISAPLVAIHVDNIVCRTYTFLYLSEQIDKFYAKTQDEGILTKFQRLYS